MTHENLEKAFKMFDKVNANLFRMEMENYLMMKLLTVCV